MASNIVITGKKQSKSDVSYISAHYEMKLLTFIDEPLVQCDVPAIKYTSLVDDDNDDCKYFFSIWVFFHNHSRITGLQGKGEHFN